MTCDICYKKCLFFRRVEDPKIRRKKVVQKSGAKKWVHDFLFKVSLTFVQTLTRSIDPGSAAVSLWLSRHLDSHDSHGSERLWSIASWCVSIGWTAADRYSSLGQRA